MFECPGTSTCPNAFDKIKLISVLQDWLRCTSCLQLLQSYEICARASFFGSCQDVKHKLGCRLQFFMLKCIFPISGACNSKNEIGLCLFLADCCFFDLHHVIGAATETMLLFLDQEVGSRTSWNDFSTWSKIQTSLNKWWILVAIWWVDSLLCKSCQFKKWKFAFLHVFF